MDINIQAVELIKHYEGFMAETYHCPGGALTIGYGHVIQTNESFTNVTITQSAAEELLKQDMENAANSVRRIIKVPLNENQFGALVSFVFNLGATNFQNSTLAKLINQEEHLKVPSELIKWVHVGGKPLRGLVRRRLEEALLYVS